MKDITSYERTCYTCQFSHLIFRNINEVMCNEYGKLVKRDEICRRYKE